MSKKPDTASALAGILKAKRGEEEVAQSAPPPEPPVAAEPVPPPPPALPLPPPPVVAEPLAIRQPARVGKRSDTANFTQCSVYLRKDTRKKVGRTLEDLETGQDFSDLVQELLEQWLTSHTRVPSNPGTRVPK